MPARSEFTFELRVCQWAERHWPPAGDSDDIEVLVARQLGTKFRRWDTIVLECDPDGLGERSRFGDRPLDSDLLHVVRNAPESWAWYRDALPDPGYPWRYVREAVHRAADRDVIEKRSGENGRIELRRKWAYPDWVERVVAIENKPDLDRSAARDLAPQIHRDVALGLADEVWVATEATGEAIEPALFEDLPVEAGILTVAPVGGPDPETAGVEWHARTLDPEAPGTRILENPGSGVDGTGTPAGGSDHVAAAARFEYADPEWKASKRREIAERAYAGGWRSYADAMRPDCRHFQLRDRDGWWLPYCAAKDRPQSAAECRGSCPDFEPEPPVWRSRDWPIDGGPGAGIRRLLERQRGRRRPGLNGE